MNTEFRESGGHRDGYGNLYFASNRPGVMGRTDLFVAPPEGGLFGSPERMDDLSSDLDEDQPWISADGETLFFAVSGIDEFAIYRASRQRQ